MAEHQRTMDEGQAIQLAQRIGITDANEIQLAAGLMQRGESSRAIGRALVEAQKEGIAASRVLAVAEDHKLAVGVALRSLTESTANGLKPESVLKTMQCLADRDGGILPGHPEWQNTALETAIALGAMRKELPSELGRAATYELMTRLFDLLGSVDEVQRFLEGVIDAPRKNNNHLALFYRRTIAERLEDLEARASQGRALTEDFD